MNCIALLLMLGMMGSAPAAPHTKCSSECKAVDKHHQPTAFKHMSDIYSTSVAPWTLKKDSAEGREPPIIQYAECGVCTLDHMTAKPIYIQITVYQKANGTKEAWCRCPFNLAVGCTCVRETQPQQTA